MSIYVVGLSHKTAPLEVRERCAVGTDDLRSLLDEARGWLANGEICVLSTCNRVELYIGLELPPAPPRGARVSVPADVHEALRVVFRQIRPGATAIGDDAIYVHGGESAIRHIFRVAASLDSLVVGETQIAGQMRTAMRASQQRSMLRSRLLPVLEGALRASRRIHGETSIGEGQVSVPSVAVDFATKVYSDFSDKSALIVGGGETARLVVAHVRENGLRKFFVLNRSFDKACSLAEEVSGTAVPWERLGDVLPLSDLVVSTTGSTLPVLTADAVRAAQRTRRGKPMILLDLAVPRDIEAAAGDADGAFLYDLDDLEGIAAENRRARESVLGAAQAIIDDEVRNVLVQAKLASELGPVVAAVRRRADAIAASEIERLFGKVSDLDPKARGEIEQMTRRVVNKLLHTPLSVIKQEARNGAEQDRLELFGRLFGIEQEGSQEQLRKIRDSERLAAVTDDEAATGKLAEPADAGEADDPAAAADLGDSAGADAAVPDAEPSLRAEAEPEATR